eukprot:1157218-Pelagomonas_calceolata.AAC.26
MRKDKIFLTGFYEGPAGRKCLDAPIRGLRSRAAQGHRCPWCCRRTMQKKGKGKTMSVQHSLHQCRKHKAISDTDVGQQQQHTGSCPATIPG